MIDKQYDLRERPGSRLLVFGAQRGRVSGSCCGVSTPDPLEALAQLGGARSALPPPAATASPQAPQQRAPGLGQTPESLLLGSGRFRAVTPFSGRPVPGDGNNRRHGA